MSITTEWKLSAETVSEITVDGVTYNDVVTEVHWECFAMDSETSEKVRDYSSMRIPKPTSKDSFIDISTLQGKTDAEKRDIILGWAEQVEPGFVVDEEAKVKKMLEAKLNEPNKATVNIL